MTRKEILHIMAWAEYGHACDGGHSIVGSVAARAALEAIEAAGMVVIKRSDCEDMIESIETWAAYASDYFRDKHGLEEELAAYRAMMAAKKQP